MSSRSIERIKQIRKKEIGGFDSNSSIPFGTDGLLVDMLSGLDLEEELKLGNNHHYVEIEDIIEQVNGEDIIVTQIKEYYLDIPKGDNTIEWLDNNNHILYSIFIRLTNTDINMTLYKGNINISNKLHEKTVSINETTSIVGNNQETTSIIKINQEVDEQ